MTEASGAERFTLLDLVYISPGLVADEVLSRLSNQDMRAPDTAKLDTASDVCIQPLPTGTRSSQLATHALALVVHSPSPA